MATHKSAEKRNRQTIARTEVNRARESRVRTFARKLEEAIESGDQVAANEAFRTAQTEIMRAVTKGVLKKNTASRKVSRFAARIKKIAA